MLHNDQVHQVDRDEFELLFLNGEFNKQLRSSIEKDFDKFLSSESDNNIDLSNELNEIHQKIVKEITDGKKKFKRFLKIYMKFAVVILIPFIMAGRILLIKNFIIPFNYGSRISFDLPDGTTRMLNSGSSLEYTFPFKNNRYVKLTGEAWFEVKHDEVHPFVVNLLDSDVKVLGTSFNVSAYPEEDYIEIVLFKGSVEFINKEKNEKTLMLPSEKLVLHDDNLHKTLIDTTKYNAWIEGKLIFRSVSMGEVISRIGRWYNVDIELADEQLKSYSFRGTFINDKIEDILAFLAMTSPIKYEIIPGKMQSDSTFENEELLFL